MTVLNHLLASLVEECCEVGQRTTKAQRFGILETQPGKSLNNAARIDLEMSDLVAVHTMLVGMGALRGVNMRAMEAKRRKVLKYLRHAHNEGQISDPSSIVILARKLGITDEDAED